MKNLLLILALFVFGCASQNIENTNLQNFNLEGWEQPKGKTLYLLSLKAKTRWSGSPKIFFKLFQENKSIKIKTQGEISDGWKDGFDAVWSSLCNDNFSTDLKERPRPDEIKTKKVNGRINYIWPETFSIQCLTVSEYQEQKDLSRKNRLEELAKQEKYRENEKKRILDEKKDICKTYGFKENTDGMGLCLIELDKLAVLEQQVLDIEKRNNQTYLQNQQLLKEQKRQRQAQALMNLGSAISGAGTSGAIAPPISSPTYSDSYSSTLTVNQGDVCPRLNSPLVKQEVRGVNRICYYQ